MGEPVIPIVDLCGAGCNDSLNEELLSRISEEIVKAFSTVGFVCLINHGVPADQVRFHHITDISLYYTYIFVL